MASAPYENNTEEIDIMPSAPAAEIHPNDNAEPELGGEDDVCIDNENFETVGGNRINGSKKVQDIGVTNFLIEQQYNFMKNHPYVRCDSASVQFLKENFFNGFDELMADKLFAYYLEDANHTNLSLFDLRCLLFDLVEASSLRPEIGINLPKIIPDSLVKNILLEMTLKQKEFLTKLEFKSFFCVLEDRPVYKLFVSCLSIFFNDASIYKSLLNQKPDVIAKQVLQNNKFYTIRIVRLPLKEEIKQSGNVNFNDTNVWKNIILDNLTIQNHKVRTVFVDIIDNNQWLAVCIADNVNQYQFLVSNDSFKEEKQEVELSDGNNYNIIKDDATVLNKSEQQIEIEIENLKFCCIVNLFQVKQKIIKPIEPENNQNEQKNQANEEIHDFTEQNPTKVEGNLQNPGSQEVQIRIEFENLFPAKYRHGGMKGKVAAKIANFCNSFQNWDKNHFKIQDKTSSTINIFSKKVTELNQEYKISQKTSSLFKDIQNKISQIDEKYQISKKTKNKIQEVDQKYELSRKASEKMDKIKSNPKVKVAVTSVVGFSHKVSRDLSDIAKETSNRMKNNQDNQNVANGNNNNNPLDNRQA